ncbi:MAG: 2-phosphosulfolactate phosphatase [Oscillospiraceae bacterium]|jgi:2-phosphosulfolactate phosphatase|nr:2-phosphosulfolactate phosphatase [Oscillospiraceae bacterium]
MNMNITAYPTADAAPSAIDADLALVIDTLRMTSVAATALANGCAGLLAVETVDEARELAPRHGSLLGGERGGTRVDGFDLGNSPIEYTVGRVSGKSLVVTTTNGTRAVAKARSSRRVWLASLLNARAVADRLRSSGFGGVAMICAGTQGMFSMEDALTAGAIIHRLDGMASMDDFAQACMILYGSLRHDLTAALRGASHAKRLASLGFARDVEFCLREDSLEAIPALGGDGWFVLL